MNLRIRMATENDAHVLTEFNCRLAWETENRRLDQSIVGRGVQRGLQQKNDVQYWVAESDSVNSTNRIVGQLMLTREWSDWRDGWVMWLQSVYLDQDFRGKGVFRQLLQRVIQELQSQSDVAGLRLYVECENQRAVDVYHRLSFADAGYRVMERMF